jgi:AmiR/NasT family two-component response regulator
MTANPVSFRGQTALILHKNDRDKQVLETQLIRLGMVIESRIPATREQWAAIDVCFFDTDRRKHHAFPWPAQEPALPLVALLGTETPERIQSALVDGVASFLVKPVRSTGTYLALLQAVHNFSQANKTRLEMNDLRERVRARRLLFKVLLRTMQRWNLDEDQAYEKLRTESMQCQLSIEQYCARVLAAGCEGISDMRAIGSASPPGQHAG